MPLPKYATARDPSDSRAILINNIINIVNL